MGYALSQQVAQQIVDTVKDVCNYDINYINSDGVIIASTDMKRIGDFHSIGKKVAEKNEIIEIATDEEYPGIKKGVNIPFLYNGKTIAAIGISGNPELVRKYAYLAQKISNIIIAEHEIDVKNHNKKMQKNYIINSIISGDSFDMDYTGSFLEKNGYDIREEYRVIVVDINAKENLSVVEDQVKQTFKHSFSLLYSFHYPNRYVLIMENSKWNLWNYMFRILAEKYKNVLKIGVGITGPIYKQNRSFLTAKLAILNCNAEENVMLFENLDLEILIASIPESTKKYYRNRVLKNMSEKDQELLKMYYDCNMSLKETSIQSYTHKNTVQYQLDRIWKKTSYNPRIFQDAVILYLALKL